MTGDCVSDTDHLISKWSLDKLSGRVSWVSLAESEALHAGHQTGVRINWNTDT